MIEMPFVFKLFLSFGLLCYLFAAARATDRSAATSFLSKYKDDPSKLFNTFYFDETMGNNFCSNSYASIPLTLDENRNLEELEKFWSNTTYTIVTIDIKHDFLVKVVEKNYNFHVKRTAFKVMDRSYFEFDFQFDQHSHYPYQLLVLNRKAKFMFSFVMMTVEQFEVVVDDMKYFDLTEQQLEQFWKNVMETSKIPMSTRCSFAYSHDLFTIPFFKTQVENYPLQSLLVNSVHYYFVARNSKICLLDDLSIKSSKRVSHVIRVFATHYKHKLSELLDSLCENPLHPSSTVARFNADALKDIFDSGPADDSTIQRVIRYIATNHFSKAITITGTSSSNMGAIIHQQKNDLLFLLKNIKYFVEKSDYNTLRTLFSAASHLMHAMQTVDNIESLGIKASNNLLLNRTLEYEKMPHIVPEYLIFSRHLDFQNSSIYLSLSPTAQAAYMKYFPPVFETFPIIPIGPTRSSSSNTLPSGTSYEYVLRQTVYDKLTPGSLINRGMNIFCWKIIDVHLDRNIDTDGINQFKKVIDTFIDVTLLENIKQYIKDSNLPSKHLEQLSKLLDARTHTLNNHIDQDMPVSNSTSAGVTLTICSSTSNRIFFASLMMISLFYVL